MDIPNLDSLGDEELDKWSDLFQSLVDYCDSSLAARRARKRGNIKEALVYEADCDSIYKYMPREVRW